MSEAGNRSRLRSAHDGGLSLRQFYRNEYQNSFTPSPRNVNNVHVAWRGKSRICACSRWRRQREGQLRRNVGGRRLVPVELAGRDWHENEVKKRRREEEWDGERREEGRRSERERGEPKRMAQKARTKRKGWNLVLMKRDNLCSSCNSSVIPLYCRARPVLATLPAYIFVFVRSPASGRRNEKRTGELNPGMPVTRRR